MWLLLITLFNAYTGDTVAQVPFTTFSEQECHTLGRMAVENTEEYTAKYACVPAPVLTLQKQQTL